MRSALDIPVTITWRVHVGLSDNKAKMYYGPVPSYQFMTEAVTQSEWQCEIKDCVTIFSSLHAYFICRYLNMYVFYAPKVLGPPQWGSLQLHGSVLTTSGKVKRELKILEIFLR